LPQLGDRMRASDGLEVMAELACAEERGERSARLLGAVAALREHIHTPFSATSRDHYESIVCAVGMLGSTAFDSAWNAGRAMLFEDAVEYALESTIASGRSC